MRARKPPPPFLDSQEVRVLRALAEYGGYEVREVEGAGRRWYDVHKKGNGESYEVSLGSCSCWDAVRLEPYGLVCKHVLILQLALDRGEVLPAHAVIPRRPAA